MTNDQDRSVVSVDEKRPAKRSDRNRKRRKRNGKQAQKTPTAGASQNPQKEKKRKPGKAVSSIVVPRIQEPVPECALCGKPIEAIAQAIRGPEPDMFNHFDCVLRKLAEEEHVLPSQKISYIGKGSFAVVETDTEGKFIIIKRIPYENPETFASMKRFVEEQKR
jgi:hypothetical protein